MSPKLLQFRLSTVLFVIGVICFALWVYIPTATVRFEIATDKSVRLNGVRYAQRENFVEALTKKVERCQVWGIEPRVEVIASEEIPDEAVHIACEILDELKIYDYMFVFVDDETGRVVFAGNMGRMLMGGKKGETKETNKENGTTNDFVTAFLDVNGCTA